jgi:hypothetical protein
MRSTLIGVFALSPILSGCAHITPVADAETAQAGPASELQDRNGALDFCSDREWVCILGGIAIFGGAVAALKSSGGD